MSSSECLCVSCQANIQATLRPGIWIPGLRNLHYKEELWDLEYKPDEAFDIVSRAVQRKQDKWKWHIRKLDKTLRFVQLYVLSKYNWLDVVEIRLKSQEQWSQARVRSFSSGIFPVCIPLSPFLSALFCFIPYTDGGINQKRLDSLRVESNAALSVFDS
eukprot:scpid42389/ scgid26137/ 